MARRPRAFGFDDLASIGWLYPDSPRERLDFLAELSPFHPKLGLGALFLPEEIRNAIPLVSTLTEGPRILRGWDATLERDYSGKNPDLEAALRPLLARGLDRSEVLRLTNFPLPIFEHVIATVTRYEKARPTVTNWSRRLRGVVDAKVPLSPTTLAEITQVRDYMAAFPNKARLSAWRRRWGIRPHDDRRWNITLWRSTEKTLVARLTGLGTRASLTKRRAGVLAFHVLRARHPQILAANALAAFLKRNNAA